MEELAQALQQLSKYITDGTQQEQQQQQQQEPALNKEVVKDIVRKVIEYTTSKAECVVSFSDVFCDDFDVELDWDNRIVIDYPDTIDFSDAVIDFLESEVDDIAEYILAEVEAEGEEEEIEEEELS